MQIIPTIVSFLEAKQQLHTSREGHVPGGTRKVTTDDCSPFTLGCVRTCVHVGDRPLQARGLKVPLGRPKSSLVHPAPLSVLGRAEVHNAASDSETADGCAAPALQAAAVAAARTAAASDRGGAGQI